MSDLISRAELFNRLATEPIDNESRTVIYTILQGMETVEEKAKTASAASEAVSTIE